MTFSQLRNQVNALRLEYDRDLAVSRLRPVAKQIAEKLFPTGKRVAQCAVPPRHLLAPYEACPSGGGERESSAPEPFAPSKLVPSEHVSTGAVDAPSTPPYHRGKFVWR